MRTLSLGRTGSPDGVEEEGTQRPHTRSYLPPTGLLAIVAIVVLLSFWYERYQPWAALLAAVAFVAAVDAGGWWRSHRRTVVVVAVDLALVFLYLWSLDDSVHVVIQSTPSGYVARVGNDTAEVHHAPFGNRIGFYAGDVFDYRVLPTGEEYYDVSAGQQELPVADTPFYRFGQAVRYAVPMPAWGNVQIVPSSPSSSPTLRSMAGTAAIVSRLQLLSGTWSVNRRGELEGGLGSQALLDIGARSGYTISADLMRGDGGQGIIVGVGTGGEGYVLKVRLDQPDALWFRWNRGQIGVAVGGTPLHVSMLPTVQRLVRLALGNVIAALIILLLALPLYVLLARLLSLTGEGDSGDVAVIERFALREPVPAVAVAVMALGAVVITAVIATDLLQRIPHVQDSVAYLFGARTLALGRLSVPVPKLHAFFTEEFIPMYHGQWFSKYPPGWPVLLALGVLAHIPWLIDPILAGACVLLIYLIGREVYGPVAALLAAAITLSSPFFLLLGGSFMAHTSTLFYLCGFAYGLIRWLRRVEDGRHERGDDWKLLLPSGFLLGMALITRQLDGIAFALPFLLPLAWRHVFRRILAFRWFVLGLAPPLLGLLMYNWHLSGSPLTSPYSLWWPFDNIGFGTGPSYDFGPAQGVWNTALNLEMLLAHLYGWPFYCTLALAALPFLVGKACRWDAIFGASALCVIGAYFLYWTPGIMFGPRYFYAAIPWLSLLSARGLVELYGWPLRLPFAWAHDRLAALVVPCVVLLLLLVYNLAVYFPAQIPLYRGYNYVDAAPLQAVDRAHIHHALVFVVTQEAGDWQSYGEGFSQNSPLLDGDIVYAHDRPGKDAQLMAAYPGRQYYRLNGTKLTHLEP